MKLETINKYTSLLDDMITGEYSSIKDFCEKNQMDYGLFTVQISNLRKVTGEYKDLCDEAIRKYDDFKVKKQPVEDESQEESTETIDNDDKSEVNQIRDKDGKIIHYSFRIFKKNKAPILGKFDRNEMNQLYGLYSYYGNNLQQRVVSRYFPDYSLVDIKRILRAFNITKASSPFAPHMYEEHTEDELKEILARLKENNFLKRVEKDQLNDLQKLNDKIAKENLELKQKLTDLSDIHIDMSNMPVVDTESVCVDSNNILILHLADMHIGARLSSGCLYNNEWNEKELTRRLSEVLNKIKSLGGYFSKIYLNLMGDILDGMDEQTARRDHMMPQNMDNKEQFNTFIKVMTWFIGNLRAFAGDVIINSVPEGNHDGDYGYVATYALKAVIEHEYDLQFNLSNKFISHYKIGNEVFILCHGKDAKFMKKPMPKDLNDKTDIWLRDYLDYEGLNVPENYGHIHVIKADLHSNALSANRKYTYRNVLSLFGESDYSQMNYPKNGYGISYDMLINDSLVSGTFENF